MRRIRCNRQKSERDVFSHLMHILFQLQLLRCKRVELFFAVCDVPTFERIVILSTVGAIECGGNRGRERHIRGGYVDYEHNPTAMSQLPVATGKLERSHHAHMPAVK
jgi:hypothetical protein